MSILWKFAKKSIKLTKFEHTTNKGVCFFMKMKRSIWGYSVKDVERRLSDYENLIDLQRRDIEYLKRDNSVLKSAINEYAEKER